MADIIPFVPRAELSAEENLRSFVRSAKEGLTVFGENLDFESDVWDVTAALHLKRANRRQRLIFSTWESRGLRNFESMAEPFKGFAKASIRYHQTTRPVKSVGSRLTAMRVLEAALIDIAGAANPVAITPLVLNRAAQFLCDSFGGGAAYSSACFLQMTADFIAWAGIMAVPVQWKNPVPNTNSNIDKVGDDFDKMRREKLPSPAAIQGIATVFNLGTSPADVITSSTCAILCSAPDRINEVLFLPERCEATEIDDDKKDVAYGLRWRPFKGADPQIKWMIPSMVDVVKRAIANIRKCTDEARAIARWYEEHPMSIYLPGDLEQYRDRKILQLDEVAKILFVEDVGNPFGKARQWCLEHGVEMPKVAWKVQVNFHDLEVAVLKLLPAGFPIANEETGLNYSEALFLVQRNLLNACRATYRCAIHLVGDNHIAKRLGQGSYISIFDRFGIREEDGSKIKISTNQFRHYLNTIAQLGGLSQLEIAWWSGRKNLQQNNAYDHQSDSDILTLLRQTLEKDEVGRDVVAPDRALMIRRDEFLKLKIPTAHTTDFGYCVHDFAALPCHLHRDCLNCDEQWCIKGDHKKEAQVRLFRDEAKELLCRATEAEGSRTFGAGRWVEHQRKSLERATQLCALFDRSDVRDGTVIRPSGVVPASHLALAEARRLSAGSETRALPKPEVLVAMDAPSNRFEA